MTALIIIALALAAYAATLYAAARIMPGLERKSIEESNRK